MQFPLFNSLCLLINPFFFLHFNVYCNFMHFILYIVIHSGFLSTEEGAVLRKCFRVKFIKLLLVLNNILMI